MVSDMTRTHAKTAEVCKADWAVTLMPADVELRAMLANQWLGSLNASRLMSDSTRFAKKPDILPISAPEEVRKMLHDKRSTKIWACMCTDVLLWVLMSQFFLNFFT